MTHCEIVVVVAYLLLLAGWLLLGQQALPHTFEFVRGSSSLFLVYRKAVDSSRHFTFHDGSVADIEEYQTTKGVNSAEPTEPNPLDATDAALSWKEPYLTAHCLFLN